MSSQPTGAIRHDREHDDDLGEEEEPDEPIPDGGERRPRLARRGLLRDKDRDHEERADDDRHLEASLDALGPFHDGRFDVAGPPPAPPPAWGRSSRGRAASSPPSKPNVTGGQREEYHWVGTPRPGGSAWRTAQPSGWAVLFANSWRLFFEFLSHTGLRIGEAIALRWSDLDFNRRRVTVERRFYRGTFDQPKSKYGRRKVPLSEGMARELEARWLLVDDVEGLVFPSEAGTVIDSSNLMQRVLKKAGRRAGVPWVGFHSFRHTCATTLFRSGLNAKQVQVWLGHHSPAFTLGTYVHFLDDDLPSADFLDGVTAGGNREATSPTETPLRPVGDAEADSPPLAGESLGELRLV